MAIDATKDFQLSINQNAQSELSSDVEEETTFSKKITKECIDELIQKIDKLINGAS